MRRLALLLALLALPALPACGPDAGHATTVAGQEAAPDQRAQPPSPGAQEPKPAEAGGEGHPGVPSPTAGSRTGVEHVVLLGLDGADWEIIDRLAATGRLPNLSRLRAEGAHGVLRSEEPLLSPIVWTTIATGRSPSDHGIIGFLTQLNGVTEPVRSDERKVRAFWNIAGDLGASVGVIGWYASWPAEKVNGFLVSDRVGSHQIQGSASAASSGLVYPPDLAPEIARLHEAVDRDIVPASLGRFFSSGRVGGAPVRLEQQKLDTFLGIVRTTEIYRRLAPVLLKRFDPDIAAIYFEGTDAAGHLFGEYAPPPLPWVTAEEARTLGDAFDRYYMYIDEVVGEFVSQLDRTRTTLMIVSDHGFKTGARRPRTPTSSPYGNQAPLWHRPEGILILWGRGIRSGVSLPESSIYDVLPTVLRAAGLPIALNLKGRPVDTAFDSGLLSRPVRSVADFEAAGERERAAVAEASSDEQMAKLQALGYVGGSGKSQPPVAEPGSEGQESIPLNRYNEAIILLESGKRAEAMSAFRTLQIEAPRFPLGFLGEGLVHIQESDPQSAVAPLEKALQISPGLAIAHAYLGEAYLRSDREDLALASLEKSLEIDGSQGRPALLLAQLLFSRREFEEASRWFEVSRTSADNPSDRARACVGLAILAEERKQLGAAAERYEEALSIVPGFGPALERYGNLELFRGNPGHAAELLSQLVEVEGDKTDPGILMLYARALASSGRTREAAAVLRRSLSANPNQADARSLLDELSSGHP